TFERDIEGTYSRGFMYTRNDNPNRQALERGVSMLEGGEAAAAFASGTGATMSILQALTPGDHILAHIDAYYGTPRLIREIFLRTRGIQYEGGAVPSPFDCWLILRGMRTLPWRMRAHSENALKVAEFLARHRKVARVHYPGLRSHPGHEIAARQMSLFGGMLSLEVKEGYDAAMSVVAKT